MKRMLVEWNDDSGDYNYEIFTSEADAWTLYNELEINDIAAGIESISDFEYELRFGKEADE
jgi:hypothetical protein